MKKLLIVAVIFMASCKKDDPKETCYMCVEKAGSTLVKQDIRCTPQEPTSSYTDTLGRYIIVTCKVTE